MWEPQRAALSSHAGLFTPDLPGFGREPRLDGEPFSMDLAAAYIESQLDAQGIERCVLGGLSMGGYIALACWKLFPERIAGMILADTKAAADTEETREGRYRTAEKLGRGEYEDYVEETLGKLLSEGTRKDRPDVTDAVRTIIYSSQPESIVPPLFGMAARPDSTSLLPTISVPVALIFGEHDEITKVEEGKTMEQALPDATLTVIPGAGHLSNIENPEAFNNAVIELLRVVSSS